MLDGGKEWLVFLAALLKLVETAVSLIPKLFKKTGLLRATLRKLSKKIRESAFRVERRLDTFISRCAESLFKTVSDVTRNMTSRFKRTSWITLNADIKKTDFKKLFTRCSRVYYFVPAARS